MVQSILRGTELFDDEIHLVTFSAFITLLSVGVPKSCAGVTPVLRRCYAGVTPVLRRCYAGVTPELRRSYARVTPELRRLLLRLSLL